MPGGCAITALVFNSVGTAGAAAVRRVKTLCSGSRGAAWVYAFRRNDRGAPPARATNYVFSACPITSARLGRRQREVQVWTRESVILVKSDR